MNTSTRTGKTIVSSAALISILMLSAWPLIGFNPEKENPSGTELLDSLVLSFKELANSGKGGYEAVNKVLQNSMAGLKKAGEQGRIDAVFYMRYKRMLTIMKLAVIDTSYDPEGILDDFILRELSDFDEDVTGLKSERENRGIGALAGAIAEEILNLHIYLDGLKNRDKLVDKYRLR